MKIKAEYPPNIDSIRKVFPNIRKGTVFAYGDTIYNPDQGPVPPSLAAHELVHSKQQGSSPAEWWDRYLVDPAFRCYQEIEAYQAQYVFLKEEIRDRNRLAVILDKLARDLSGEMYGTIIPYSDALRVIRSNKKYVFKT